MYGESSSIAYSHMDQEGFSMSMPNPSYRGTPSAKLPSTARVRVRAVVCGLVWGQVVVAVDLVLIILLYGIELNWIE